MFFGACHSVLLTFCKTVPGETVGRAGMLAPSEWPATPGIRGPVTRPGKRRQNGGGRPPRPVLRGAAEAMPLKRKPEPTAHLQARQQRHVGNEATSRRHSPQGAGASTRPASAPWATPPCAPPDRPVLAAAGRRAPRGGRLAGGGSPPSPPPALPRGASHS